MNENYHKKKLLEMAESNIEAIIKENEGLKIQNQELQDAVVELGDIIGGMIDG